jgi:hypothetical protein
MIVQFPQPRFMPCSDCGAAVERVAAGKHVCERERLVEYQMFQLRDEVADVESELGEYLDSPSGRFEVWWAERERRYGGGTE